MLNCLGRLAGCSQQHPRLSLPSQTPSSLIRSGSHQKASQIFPTKNVISLNLPLTNQSRSGIHTSSFLASARRQKMKLRKHRRSSKMLFDVEAHLAQDLELRKEMLKHEQGLEMAPGDKIPTLLKEQIERELKDPKLAAELKSGPEGRKRVLDHFKTLGTQIDRLYKLKEFEKKVLEKEKLARELGEDLEGEELSPGDENFFDRDAALKAAFMQSNEESTMPGDIVDRAYQEYRTKQFKNTGEEEDDVIQFMPDPKNFPPEMQKAGANLINDLGSVGIKSAKKSKEPQIQYERKAVPREVVHEPSPITQVEIPTTAEDILTGELKWPTKEELEDPSNAFPEEKDDLSPFSRALRAERLRRAQEQDLYESDLRGSSLEPMPRFLREWITVQLSFGHEIPDKTIRPYLPPGLTKEEFFEQEGLLPEQQEATEAIIAEAQAEEQAVDVDASQLVPGSCCISLRQAVQRRHLSCLSALCDKSQAASLNGETPIHIAAILEDTSLCKEILDRKMVEVDALSNTRSTALHMSCLRGDFETTKLLLARGAQPNKADDDGLTALHLAVAGGASTSLINYLIDHKANILLGDNQGATALHIASEAGNIPVIKLLLKKGANLNDVTGERETPLFLACEQGHVEIAELLMANGADPNISNHVGFFPLHAATKAGFLPVVQTLLRNGANPYATDCGDNTALHIAVLGGHAEISRHLIAAKCPIQAENTEGYTALHIAAQGGYAPCVELLLDVGMNINARNDEGSTPLMIAMSAEKFDLVPLLVSRGADVNIGDAHNVTPLLLALQSGRADTAQFLLEKGARVQTLTTDHITPLHMALEEELWDIAQILLDKGVNPLQASTDGYLAIHIAAAHGNVEWVQKLISAGTDPNMMTKAGLTPLKIAEESGHVELVNFLRKEGARELDIFTWMEMEEKMRKIQNPEEE